MAKRQVPVTYAFGRRDRVDPKLAPFGVLKVGKNLRVRKDGRLGTRNGYQPLTMTTRNGTLSAYDVFEYRERLVALGNDAGDDYPTELFEYLGIEGEAWRGSDRFGRRVTLDPFTDLREVAGIPQPDDGIDIFDAAASGGYVCLAYSPRGVATAVNARLFVVVVDSATDQVVLSEDLTASGHVFSDFLAAGAGQVRVTASAGEFFIVGVPANDKELIRIARYAIGDSQFALFVDPVPWPGGTGPNVTALDLVPVSGATTAVLAVAYDRVGVDLQIKVYDTTGAQVGSTASVAGTSSVHLAIEANQADNTINLYTVETATTGRLRTFNFAGTLLDGPTATVSGASGSICRLPAMGSLAESVAVAVNTTTNNVSVTVYDQDTHAAGTPFVVQNALLRTRLVSGQSLSQPAAVVFGGVVAPILPDDDQATNALFFVTATAAHVAFRDYVRAIDPGALANLTLDETTGQLCWPALFDPGVDDVAMPVVSLVGFQSTARRHGVSFGSLHYQAGAAPSVYDGRFPAELGFGEAPGIVSVTAGTDAAHETAAALTGYSVGPGVLTLTGRTLVFAVEDGGVSTSYNVTFAFAQPATAAAAFIEFLYPAALTASVTDGKLTVGTVATGADVSLTLVSGTGADELGLDLLVGRKFYGSSALAPGGTYFYTVHWEVVLADKSLMLGPPSVGGAAGDDFERASSVTLASGQNTATVVVTTPHSVRVAMGDALFGGDVTAVLSRTEFEPFSGTAKSIFRRCVSQRVPTGMANYGELLTIIDTVNDDDLGVQEALYTQAARGSLSGPLEQNAPQPCSYITATESRLITGGLGRESMTQVSREAFTGEVFSFSDFSPFFSVVAGPVVGVKSLDSARLVFTSDRIYAVTGVGPDDLGGGGFDPPVEIPTPSGLEDAWSFLDAPDGLWFQLDDTKLYRIPRGGGAPTWEGVDVEDTLLTFSRIVGTAKHKRDGVALFACCDPATAEARFLVRDFRTESWFEDTPIVDNDSLPGGHGVDAITSFGDSVAYVTGGDVYVQSTSAFADSSVDIYIDTQATTHPLYPFGLGGYGQIYELLLTGEFRGDCVLDCRVSYDDGQNFTALSSFDLLEANGLVIGQTIQRKWTLPQDVTSSIVIEFSISAGLSAGPTEGFVFNQVDLLVEAEDGLRELSPGEMA